MACRTEMCSIPLNVSYVGGHTFYSAHYIKADNKS